MMHPLTIREPNGRILGKLSNDNEFLRQYVFENETWFDKKIRPEDIIFPRHDNYAPSPVKTYHISELEEVKE